MRSIGYMVGAGLLIGVLVHSGGRVHSGGSGEQSRAAGFRPAVDLAAIGQRVDAFCGDCHAVPQPRHFPRDGWFWLVNKGYQQYFDTGRNDFDTPPMHEVVEYYRREAPDTLIMPDYSEQDTQPSTRFIRTAPSFGIAPGPLHAVSYIQWLPTRLDGPAQLVFTDMRGGGLYCASYGAPITTALNLGHPAHMEPCDLDQDGVRDFVVADLGGFPAEDHLKGRVVWVRGNGSGFDEPVTLWDKIGRVADAREGDFDGDGDPDLVVAEFGWRKTGSVFLLLNRGLQEGRPVFEKQVIDERHGTIHVPPIDFNGDGRLDFVALISQEYESVEVFLNVDNRPGQAGVRFDRQIIFEADTPAFGVSGMELVDLDRDGDCDVLLSNGDVIDTEKIRPYQGVQWLENRGTFPFHHRELTVLPGVHRALAADLDGDQDLDIAAVALLPEFVLATEDPAKLAAVIWLEQTEPGVFVRHTLETATCHHAALALGDFDGDSDIDLAVGNYFFERDSAGIPWMNIWLNQLAEQGANTEQP